MRVHYLQHVPFEGLGSLVDAFARRGDQVSGSRLYEGGISAEPATVDLLVVMGGPMGVQDEADYPWMAREKHVIAEVIEGGGKVLGICLGAQLVASVLGAVVGRNPEPEIGWFPIRKCPEAEGSVLGRILPESVTAFHWHGDRFAIPDGAIPLYRSAACDNQGFVYQERVVGLQFHLETTPESAAALVEHSAAALVDAPYVQSAGEILQGWHDYAAMHRAMRALVDVLAP